MSQTEKIKKLKAAAPNWRAAEMDRMIRERADALGVALASFASQSDEYGRFIAIEAAALVALINTAFRLGMVLYEVE